MTLANLLQRTRKEILLDQQAPKTVTTRHRGKYQFPHLSGYNGPTPPDMETIIARQEELERANSASIPLSDHGTNSSLASLDEDTSSESATEEVNQDLIETTVNPFLRPGPDAQTPIALPEQSLANPLAEQSTSTSIESSFRIPDIVFFPEDLAKGRENALKICAAYENEIQSQSTSFKTTLAQANQRATELQQQLDDLREGFNTRLNTEKQEHQREISALKAFHYEMQIRFEETITTKDEDLKAMSNKIIALEAFAPPMEKQFRAIVDATYGSKQTDGSSDAAAPPPPSPQTASTQTDPLPPLPLPPQPQPIPQTNQPSIKPLLSSLRNAHIRLAGHLRTTTEAHTSHKAVIDKLHYDLEEDEITMKGVMGVVKELVGGARKVDGALGGAREASDEVKGEVMALMDGAER